MKEGAVEGAEGGAEGRDGGKGDRKIEECAGRSTVGIQLPFPKEAYHATRR